MSYSKIRSSLRGNERPRFGNYFVTQQRVKGAFRNNFNLDPKEFLKILLQPDDIEERHPGPRFDEQVQVAVDARISTCSRAEDPGFEPSMQLNEPENLSYGKTSMPTMSQE